MIGDDEKQDRYASYGKNLGLAFQMVDDILDITQSSQTLGKPAMLDFKEEKLTIHIYIYMKELKIKSI